MFFNIIKVEKTTQPIKENHHLHETVFKLSSYNLNSENIVGYEEDHTMKRKFQEDSQKFPDELNEYCQFTRITLVGGNSIVAAGGPESIFGPKKKVLLG